MKTTVTAIDFGTSKIVTLVAEHSGAQRCDIVGIGIAAYDGYLREGWNNPGAVDEAILSSVKDAEEQAHTKLHDVNVGIPAAFTRVYPIEAKISLKGTDPKVTSADLAALYKQAEQNLGDVMGGVVIHFSPAYFVIDGNKRTYQPINQSGRELSALITYVVADRFFIDDVRNRMAALNLNVQGFYSTAAGEAMLYLPEADRDNTCVLIDVGYLNTDVMIAQGDALSYLNTIDIGGGNLAAELAMALNIRLEDAESKIKRPYVYTVTDSNGTYEIPGIGGQKGQTFTRDQVSAIIEPVVDDLAAQIRQAIDESGVHLNAQSAIYMTGGGLMFNRGGMTYLSTKLGKPIREIPKRAAKLNSHTYSSALGLMDLIISTLEVSSVRTGGIKEFFRSLMGG